MTKTYDYLDFLPLALNMTMASGGYPWTVIPVTDRNAYVNALEKRVLARKSRPSRTSSPDW
jgi:hypothetical protein